MILVIAAELENLSVIRHFIREAATALRLSPAAIDDVELAVDELATNIICHGYNGQPGDIEVEVKANGEAVEIYLRDQAPLFDPTLRPEPDLTAPLEERPIGGLGVHLARQLTDTLTYRPSAKGGNELLLTKKIDSSSPLTEEIPHGNHN